MFGKFEPPFYTECYTFIKKDKLENRVIVLTFICSFPNYVLCTLIRKQFGVSCYVMSHLRFQVISDVNYF